MQRIFVVNAGLIRNQLGLTKVIGTLRVYRKLLNEALRGFRLDEEIDLGPPEVRIGGQNEDHSNTPIIDDGIGYIFRGEPSHMEKGYGIFLDALGMKGIWRRIPPNRVIIMWKNAIQSFMYSIEGYRASLNENPSFRVLSDTTIITIPVELTYLSIGQVFDLLLKPFMHSIEYRMLFRGTISYGEYYLSTRLILGPALDEAANLNNKLNWIGIAITPQLARSVTSLRDSIELSTASAIWYDNVLLKERQVYRGVVLNWPYHDTDGNCYRILVR